MPLGARSSSDTSAVRSKNMVQTEHSVSYALRAQVYFRSPSQSARSSGWPDGGQLLHQNSSVAARVSKNGAIARCCCCNCDVVVRVREEPEECRGEVRRNVSAERVHFRCVCPSPLADAHVLRRQDVPSRFGEMHARGRSGCFPYVDMSCRVMRVTE